MDTGFYLKADDKFEARNPKFETISNDLTLNFRKKKFKIFEF